MDNNKGEVSILRSKNSKCWVIWLVAGVVSIVAVTIGVIAYIKIKAHKLNRALFEASEFIAFDDDDDTENMLVGIDDMCDDDECESDCGCKDLHDSSPKDVNKDLDTSEEDK